MLSFWLTVGMIYGVQNKIELSKKNRRPVMSHKNFKILEVFFAFSVSLTLFHLQLHFLVGCGEFPEFSKCAGVFGIHLIFRSQIDLFISGVPINTDGYLLEKENASLLLNSK